jgi:peptide/nickel transport system substrate-binding protein
VATRNEDYWRGPNGITGEDLPHLDAVELVVAVDIEARANGLRSGQFDVIHTANSDEITQAQEDGDLEVVTGNEFGETSYILLNNAQGSNAMTGAEIDPEGTNADNPLTTQACRKALAHAMDKERYLDDREAGLPEPANGPFPPGSIGYLEDTGYPAYDLDLAETEMERCLAERGTESIEFTFNTTNDPFNVESQQLWISMWQEAFGDRVQATITPIEQGQYIGLALTGNFNAQQWRSHGGIDPDQQILWWISATASPIGQLALNFGRMSDPVIDENLLTIRTNPDPDARREAAENVNRRFSEQVYNFWNYWTVWGVLSDPSVNAILDAVSPDGDELLPLLSGRHQMPQLWCEGGTCGSE